MREVVYGETRPVERYVIVPLCILIVACIAALILSGVIA